MALDDLARDGEARQRDRWIGVYIGVLAVILAICTLAGGNATKDATLRNIEASDTWAFFQAKNIRRQIIRVRAEELELILATTPDMPPATRSAYETRLKEYRERDQALTSEPQTGEGIEELLKRGKALEAERDRAMRKDPYFDYATALLQIAIVLASVAIIAGGSWLLVASGFLAVLGTLLMLNGLTLFLVVPFVG